MAFEVRQIKDRVATGDNTFLMERLPDGRIALTPAPDSVTEVGTDINRALLQPIEERVVWLMNSLYDNFTSNPFYIEFGDLEGLQVTGVWDAGAKRIEC